MWTDMQAGGRVLSSTCCFSQPRIGAKQRTVAGRTAMPQSTLRLGCWRSVGVHSQMLQLLCRAHFQLRQLGVRLQGEHYRLCSIGF